MTENGHNTQLHSQARGTARRAWQLPNIMPICSSKEFKFLNKKVKINFNEV